MKRSRLFLITAVAFLLGYAAHAGIGIWRFAQRRAALQSYYEAVFRSGESAEAIVETQREKGLDLRYEPDAHRYFVILPADYSRCLRLYVETDANKKIQKVRVVPIVLQ